MTINVERNQMWADALRSGNYTQGTSYLRIPQNDGESFTYCCLGVATEVAIANGLDLGQVNPYADNGLPAPAVVDWFGWGTNNPHVGVETHNCGRSDCRSAKQDIPLPASGANDDAGWSFAQIADGIEQFIIGKAVAV